MPHNSHKMWTDFNISFTVVFVDELQIKMVLDLPPHTPEMRRRTTTLRNLNVQLYSYSFTLASTTYTSDLLG